MNFVENHFVREAEMDKSCDRAYCNKYDGEHIIIEYNMNEKPNDICARIAVIIPTYNEAGNIGKLIDELQTIFATKPEKEFNIVIVDDNSPDGTAQIIQAKNGSYNNIHLISRSGKMGLGSAYMEGFIFAMNELRADAVVEFDADFQHPPQTVAQLIDKLDEGYDFVMGSRHIGGVSGEKRGILRSSLTNIGGLVARFVLFFPGRYFRIVTDPTSGLRATRMQNILDRIVVERKHLYSKGFGYKMQTLSEILDMGVRYAEIPLYFDRRYSGHSKMTATTFLEVLWSCVRSRLHESNTVRFVRFAAVGTVGYIVNAFALYLVAMVSPWEPLTWAIATEIAIISNFLLNNHWTFSHTKIRGISRTLRKFAQFNMTSVGAIVIQAVFGSLGVYILGPEYRQLILPFTTLFLVMPYNWAMYNRVVWRSRESH